MGYSPESGRQLTQFDFYKLAIEQFREQPRMYWTRARFFVSLQAALISFLIFQLRSNQDVTIFEFSIALLGLTISLVWYGITQASRGLISTWRSIVLELEQKGYHVSTASALGDDAPDKSCERGLFQMSGELGEGTTFRFSITRMMMVLATVFVVSWLCLSVYSIVQVLGIFDCG